MKKVLIFDQQGVIKNSISHLKDFEFCYCSLLSDYKLIFKESQFTAILIYYKTAASEIIDLFQYSSQIASEATFIVISETGFESALTELSDNKINNFLALNQLTFLAEYLERTKKTNIDFPKTVTNQEEIFSLLELFSDSTFDILTTHKLTGELISASPNFMEFTGYNPLDLIGTKIGALVFPNYANLVVEQREKIIKENGIIKMDYKLVRKDGSEMWVESRGKLVRDAITGAAKQIIAISRDANDRKHTEDILNLSEARYRVIAETALDVIVSIDQDYRIQFINPAILQMFGYEVAEILNKPIECLLPEYLRGERENSIYEYLNSNNKKTRGLNLETYGLHKSGKVFAIEITFGEYLVQEGKKLYISIIRDVEERRKLQNLILESAHRLSLIFNSTSDLMYLADVHENEYTYISVNESFIKANELEVTEIVGKNLKEILEPEEYIPTVEHLASCVSSKSIVKYEESYTLHNKFITVETTLTPILDNFGNCSKILGTSKDVTIEKRNFNLLTESEIRYRLLAENATDIISKHDVNCNYYYLSNAIQSILGYAPDELIGKCAYDYLHPDDLAGIKTDIDKLISQEISFYTANYRYRKKDSTYIWIESTNKLLINADTAEIEGIISISRDITERKEFEKKLKSKIEELDTFIYRSSHDLKGPLSSLLGLVNMAKLEFSDPKPLEYFNLIEKSVKHLDGILMDLLNLTKITQGNLNNVSIDIENLILESIDGFKNLEDFKNTDVKVDCQKMPLLFFDQSLLKNILHNLIVNAIKYKDGNKLTHHIEIKSSLEDNVLKISIQDNGEGISKEVQSHIFEMFFRGNTKSSGSGLGLYIVKNAVDKLGGKIKLTSEIGVGSTFTVQIPATTSSTEL